LGISFTYGFHPARKQVETLENDLRELAERIAARELEFDREKRDLGVRLLIKEGLLSDSGRRLDELERIIEGLHACIVVKNKALYRVVGRVHLAIGTNGMTEYALRGIELIAQEAIDVKDSDK
jgi:hypothetical protein